MLKKQEAAEEERKQAEARKQRAEEKNRRKEEYKKLQALKKAQEEDIEDEGIKSVYKQTYKTLVSVNIQYA